MRLIQSGMLASLLLIAASAQAAEFNQVQYNQSAITFGYKQMGVPMEGKFGQFTARIAFDPAKLATARAQIDVMLSSIDTGSADADEAVAGKLWFDAKTYPQASFTSTGIKSLGGNRYQATGKLTIKGKTQEMTVPVTFDRNMLNGSFNIKRLFFGIGDGEWRDLSTVADDIQIGFHLVVFTAKK